MSWWDTSSISSLASQALKNAQKKIDKVLDIEAEQKVERSRKKKEPEADSISEKSESKDEKSGEGKDFWYNWMGKQEGEDPGSSSTQLSSWHLPWGSSSQDSSSPSQSSLSESSKSTSSRPSLLSSRRKEAKKKEETVSLSIATNLSDSLTKPKVEGESLPSEGSETKTSDAEQVALASDLKDLEQKIVGDETSKTSVGTAEKSGVQEQSMEESSKDIQAENEALAVMKKVESSSCAEESFKSSGSTVESKDKSFFTTSTPESQTAKVPETGWQDFDEDVEVDGADKGIRDDPIFQESPTNILSHEPSVGKLNERTLAAKELMIGDSDKNLSDVQTAPISFNPNELSYESYVVDSNAQSSKAVHALSQLASVETIPNVAITEQTPSDLGDNCSEASNVEEDSTQTNINRNNELPVVTQVCDFPTFSEEYKADNHSLTKPEAGDESLSGSSDMSVVGYPDQRGVEDVADASTTSQLIDSGSGEKSFSQEYVNISSVHGSSQAVSFDGSAFGSEDFLQSSVELEFGGVSGRDRTEPVHDLAGSTGSSDASKLDSSADTVVAGQTHQGCEGAEYSLFGDKDPSLNTGNESTQALEESEQEGTCQDSLSPSSSYVKSLIQDAMDDMSNKTEDSGSDNHSNSEAKSESSKLDSEMEKSVYSGHESSDDIETTTSSDIEILSAPHSNGDAGANISADHIPFDFSSIQSSQQHHHSDSRSSSSSNSKSMDQEGLSPDRGEAQEFSQLNLETVKEESPDSPYHPERLLKLAQEVIQQELHGGKKLAEMAEVLQARENKLVQLSKENHSLTEDANILRCQLRQAEEARNAEAADLDALTQEFTVRIGEGEKKMQAVLKEKERAKQQLAAAEKELARRSADVDVEAELEEKRQQVEELLQEGEKLSKQQLQSSTIIKKLRAKEKESDTTIASQKKKLEDQTSELDHLRVVLDSKEEMEKKQTEAIGQLNTAVQKQEKELAKLKSDLEDAQEKSRGLQVALDNSYKEIAELHKSNATQDSKAQELALSAETHVREELRMAMEREQMKFKQEREAYIMQADDLRLDMARMEKEHSRREDLLRQEITHLQTRLQEDEARSHELTQEVTSATRPLMRQIENLQATQAARASAWERVEKNLTDRLAEAQTNLAVAEERERLSSQHYIDLSAKVAALEASNASLRQEKATLVTKIEGDKSRLEELQDARNSFVAQLESSKRLLSEELSQLRQDKVHLESQLSVERTRVETEKKKSTALEEQLRILDRPRSRGTPSPSPSMSVSRQESISGSMHEGFNGSVLNWSFNDDDSGSTVGAGRTSVYDSLRQSGAAIVVENMSSQLKLREGEIIQLKSQISQLERTRESMARELVNLSNQNDELQEIKAQHEQLQDQFKELNQRYSAILQMYGEKEEQVQELRLDLQDVKEMYKSQIDALMSK